MPGPPPGNHPPGCYYINPFTGTIQRQCNALLAGGLGLAGFVGADFTPARGNNAFATFAQAWNAAQGAAKTTPQALTGNLPGPANPSVPNPLTGINAVGDFFQRLTQASTWKRVGEVAAGALLLYIGAKALTSGTPVGAAAQSVKSATKKAATVIPK